MYSIGSSIVIIFLYSLVLISLIIEASVVLLPLPVGPVTITSPLGNFANELITSGRPKSCDRRNIIGNISYNNSRIAQSAAVVDSES